MTDHAESDCHSPTLIEGTPSLLAYALAMELEASERYAELAEGMAAHDNDEVAELFRELARMEALHAGKVLARAASLDLPKIATSAYRWEYPEGPETAELHGVDYLMTPHHALTLAWHNERRAAEFFTQVAANAVDSELAGMAMNMAEEEQQHVELISKWLARYPR